MGTQLVVVFVPIYIKAKLSPLIVKSEVLNEHMQMSNGPFLIAKCIVIGYVTRCLLATYIIMLYTLKDTIDNLYSFIHYLTFPSLSRFTYAFHLLHLPYNDFLLNMLACPIVNVY